MKYSVRTFTSLMFTASALNLSANDCNSAFNIIPNPLTASSQLSGSFSGETWSGVSQCAGAGGSADLWYQFTATSSRMYIAAQGIGDLDVAIELYNSCGGSSIACRNSTGAGGLEVANVPNLTVGNTYFFSVYHAGGAPPVSQAFQVAVFFIPFVELRSQDCDQFDYTTNGIIKSTQPAPNQFTLTNYQFRFVELEAPFNTYEVISPNGTNPNYRLEWFAPVQYGRTYEVSVRIRVAEGGVFGDYGNSCIVGLQPTVLTTRLQQQFANGVFAFCNVVGADKVGAASRYRWVFNDLTAPVSVYGDGDSRLLKLQSVPGLKLNQTYIVSVFAEVNGDESPAGTFRFISMNSTVPPTGLNQSLHPCGQTYPINLAVQAVEVCSGISYTWRFTNTSQAQAPLLYTRSDGNRFLKLDWVTGLIVGNNYNVEVRAVQGGVTGTFSSVCNITIGASTAGVSNPMMLSELNEVGNDSFEITDDVFDANVTAQPDGAVMVFVNSEVIQPSLVLELYSVSGQLIARHSTGATTGEPIFWNTGNTAKGVFLLKITDGQNHQVTKKVPFF